MLVFQKKKNLSLLQSLMATVGLSQIVTACGGGGGSAASKGTSSKSSTSTDASSVITYIELEGTSAPDQLISTGNDAVKVIAGDGDDYILTFDGSDYIRGEAGNDRIWANDGDDIIYGGAGKDIIDPGDGDDKIYAGAGDDTIKLSAGFDFEDGGEGNDTLEIGSSSLSIPFTINLQTGRYYLTPQANSQTANFSSIENVKSFASVDLTIIDTIGTNVITLGSGDDTVTSEGGNDTISTGAGRDTVTLGLGSYVVDLGGGDDTLHLGAQKSMIDGGSGTDILIVNAKIGVNTLYVDLDKEFYFTEEIGQSFDGQDISLKDFESVTVIGSVTSTIIGNSSANIITGGSSNDTLTGNGGNDTLSGGEGDDVLDGGAGTDTLTGGEGADTFTFTSTSNGADTIIDFTVADDILKFVDDTNLSLVGIKTESFVVGAATDLGTGTNLITATQNVIVLTDAVTNNTGAGIQTALAAIVADTGNAIIGDGVIVVAAASSGNAKVWYDAVSGSGDAVELITLTGVSLADLANFTSDNFVIA